MSDKNETNLTIKTDTGSTDIAESNRTTRHGIDTPQQPHHGIVKSDESYAQILPEIPSSSDEKQDQPSSEKRSSVVKGARVIVRSLSNTVDDHFFRGLRPSAPANRVFINRFLMPTIQDTMAIIEPNELIDKHRAIDERELPFKELMLQVEGVTQEKIDANQDILLSCLAFATFAVFFSLFKLLYFGMSILLSDSSTTFAQWVSLALWVAFVMFSLSMYISFAYHNWVIERDRFGTGGMFFRDFLNGEREAIFPYKFARKYL